MAYIWINPVVDRMYSSEVLNEFLSKHGYKRFYTTSDWITIVKEKYRLSVEKAAYPVMDMRCPKIKNMLEELGITSKVTIPAINPILIHCGEEGSKREDLQSEEKIITTPCQALADMGNALGLKDTKFIAWNRFVELIGEEPRGNIFEASPIPPGFFSELGVKTVSITGEEDIRNYLKENLCKNTSDNGLNENKESLENKGLSGNFVKMDAIMVTE